MNIVKILCIFSILSDKIILYKALQVLQIYKEMKIKMISKTHIWGKKLCGDRQISKEETRDFAPSIQHWGSVCTVRVVVSYHCSNQDSVNLSWQNWPEFVT